MRFSVDSEESLMVMKCGDILVANPSAVETYLDKDKPSFIKAETGESLIEYSGHSADGRSDRSWSKVSYKKGATGSPEHHHCVRIETYYAIQGAGKIIVDGVEHIVRKGDQIAIKPGQCHQVSNPSLQEEFIIIVKCVPAWTVTDSYTATMPEI